MASSFNSLPPLIPDDGLGDVDENSGHNIVYVKHFIQQQVALLRQTEAKLQAESLRSQALEQQVELCTGQNFGNAYHTRVSDDQTQMPTL
ncbi:MAG: hypothetical protein ACO4AI_08970 [Prochlorothrix sp.]